MCVSFHFTGSQVIPHHCRVATNRQGLDTPGLGQAFVDEASAGFDGHFFNGEQEVFNGF